MQCEEQQAYPPPRDIVVYAEELGPYGIFASLIFDLSRSKMKRGDRP